MNTNSVPAIAAGLLIASTASAAAPPRALLDGYADDAVLEARLAVLAATHPRQVGLETIATSHQGRPIHALTLASDRDDADSRPAILIVGGLDGAELASTEIVAAVAERMLLEHPHLLDEVAVLLVPRANPDAAARFLRRPGPRSGVNARPMRDDRDPEIDEDGPNDLDGNGVITMIRRLDPPPSDRAAWVLDEGDPRLLRGADAANGELPRYSVHVEGLDDDGDGVIAEDGPGGVDPDRNFPHRWPEFASDAGPWPLSEPESLGLAKFVLERPRIYAAIVVGRGDNVVNLPDPRPKVAGGRIPAEIDEADLELHKALAESFKETTGQDRAPDRDDAGSLAAWLYHQRGIPTIACTGWWRPEPAESEEASEAESAPDTEGQGDATSDDPTAAPAAAPNAESSRGDRRRRGGRRSEETAKPSSSPMSIDDPAAWLAVVDDRDGLGFVDWTEIEHPTLGRVEIGGFVPGLDTLPPIAEIAGLADGQAAFVADLVARRPRPRVIEPTVRRLGPGLLKIDLAVVNEGRMPTATTMGARDIVPPTVVRLSVPKERIRSGMPQTVIDSIAPGGRRDLSWIVSTSPEGDPIEIVAFGPFLPQIAFTVDADGTVLEEGSR